MMPKVVLWFFERDLVLSVVAGRADTTTPFTRIRISIIMVLTRRRRRRRRRLMPLMQTRQMTEAAAAATAAATTTLSALPFGLIKIRQRSEQRSNHFTAILGFFIL